MWGAVVGGVAGALFVMMSTLTQNRWKIDDVLGVWPLHGLCGACGIAAGIFGQRCWAVGGIAFMSWLSRHPSAIATALIASATAYGLLAHRRLAPRP